MRARKYPFNRGVVTMGRVWCNACDKQAYPNRKAALAAATTQRRFTGEDLHAYHSPRCHAWHIGHSPQSHAQ